MATLNAKPTYSFQEFRTSAGAQIFRIPMQAFPFLWVYAYLVLVDGLVVLIDTGSGFGESNQQLEAGFDHAGEAAGRRIRIEDLSHVLITHGHIDHFGGSAFLRERSEALLGIHELDWGILTSYEERVAIAEGRLSEYLLEAGVRQDQGEAILGMYRLNKPLFHSMNVDFTYQAVNMRVGPFEMLHVPGHCPGQVIIRLHDILFSGDHVLGRTTPHQSPERLTLHTGLRHYLDSLEALEHWGGGAFLTLAGHDDPIHDLPGRIEEIRAGHEQRLNQILDLLEEPRSLADVSARLFGEVNGYDQLLAIEEAGAHVEYLHQHGWLRIVNVREPGSQAGPFVARYQRMQGAGMDRLRLQPKIRPDTIHGRGIH